MGWKNWPYWLRGGLIGLIIGILFNIFWGIFVYGSLKELTLKATGNYFEGVLAFLTSLIFYFAIGCVLGLLIGFISYKIEKIKR